ncbi:MAG: NADH-quinone oxidoreductase subunit N [Bacteriovoracaceae bacterium]
MMGLNYLANIGHFVPELIVCMTMFALIVIESTHSRAKENRGLFYAAGVIGLGIAFFYTLSTMSTPALSIFTGSYRVDPFSSLAKAIMILSTIGCMYLAKNSEDIYAPLKAEYSILAVGVLVGGMLLASANNMLILYIGIETLSILSYAMASLKKNSDRSSEAGLKYSIYGGVTSGIMLFGMAHIFGITGSINFTEIAVNLKALDVTQALILLPAFLLFFAGLGYKIACVPFHMWSPDVYEGSPLPVTAFFSLVPKVAGICALTRVSMEFFGSNTILENAWVGILHIAAALTMTVGNVSAIGQTSIKRMLAYSSIAHGGNMLLGVLVLDQIGATAILFYGITYLFMTLVAFGVTSALQDQYGNDHINRFKGLITRYPVMAIIMAAALFSLAGLPPFSGFVAKFNIIAAVVKKGYYVLAVVAALNSVISLYYYMKVARVMILEPAESGEEVKPFTFVNQLTLSIIALPVLLLGIFWSDIMALAEKAVILATL